jgi:hypothetical protein
MANWFHFLQDIIMLYQIIHIIDALITDAQSQTIIANNIINKQIKIFFIIFGNIFNIKLKKIINIVILNHETAII